MSAGKRALKTIKAADGSERKSVEIPNGPMAQPIKGSLRNKMPSILATSNSTIHTSKKPIKPTILVIWTPFIDAGMLILLAPTCLATWRANSLTYLYYTPFYTIGNWQIYSLTPPLCSNQRYKDAGS